MLEYLSTVNTAARWGITARRVALLCEQARIPGAFKVGTSWCIPGDAIRPGDPRFCSGGDLPPVAEKSLSSDLEHINEMAVTWPNLPWEDPDALAATIPDEPYRSYRLYVEGWLAYLRGDFERTIQNYREIDNGAVKLWACHLALVAAVSTGDYPLYNELETYCKVVIAAGLGANVTAVAVFPLAAIAVDFFVPDMIPEWLKNGEFSALPTYLKGEAFSFQTHYLYFAKEYKSAFDIARAALTFFPPENGMTNMSINLRFICAMSCCALDRQDEASIYLMGLMKDCLPNGFITPFAEHLLDLGGLLERLLEREYPEYYDAVTGLTKLVIPNWRTFHKRFAKDNISLIRDPREYQMALAAARGDTDTQIAERFHLASGTVSNYLKIVYEKLQITDKPYRKELVKYLW
jgi:hypothetical protein